MISVRARPAGALLLFWPRRDELVLVFVFLLWYAIAAEVVRVDSRLVSLFSRSQGVPLALAATWSSGLAGRCCSPLVRVCMMSSRLGTESL